MFLEGLELKERYILLKFLSRGGMGEVWVAEDKILGRKVAIKSINSKLLSSNPGSITIFLDEAKIGASLLGHPNVVAILDYGIHKSDEQEIHFIVMEYIEGLNLEEFINHIKTKIDDKTYYYISLLIAWEICRAIEYAHKKGILHRDIKPSNAFISKFGIVKIGDFGLARFVDAITRTHTVGEFNSPPYAAPEQWKDDEYDENTDTYQLGCTLYRLFTGRYVFEKSRMAQMYAHLNEEPQAPRDFCNIMTKELSDIILEMISKEGDKRASLWQFNDIIARELQNTFKLKVSVDKSNSDVIDKVCEITDFGREALEKDGQGSFNFPDFSEVLSEGIELIINDITSFSIETLEKEL